jgi:hypothetical protein
MKYPVEIAQETSLAGDGEKDRVVAGRKNGGATGCGKAAGWKSQKADFPNPLGNPAKPLGIPTFPQPRRLREMN